MSSDSADLVIIGAGPAGLAAACEAKKLGLSVILLDEQTTLGGQIYRNIEAAPLDRRAILGNDYSNGQKLVTEFRECGADYRGGTSVWNITTDGTVDYIGTHAATVSGRFVLIASGAIERPFPIRGWTLPGAMGAGAAQVLLKGSGAIPTGPVVLAGCGPLIYLLAWQYLRAGAEIAAIVDTTAITGYFRAVPHALGALMGWRDLSKGLKLLTTLKGSGVPVFSGASALAIEGETAVTALTFNHRGKTIRLAASLVLLHQGVVPNTQLSLSTGLKHNWNSAQFCWQPVTDEWGRLGDSALYVSGDSRSIVGALASATQGRLAALSIAKQLGAVADVSRRATALKRQLKGQTRIRSFLDALYQPIKEHRVPPRDDVTVCRCEEVTAGQIRNYVELGCLGPNQAKTFGRCGMGPCQGRFCGLTVTELIAEARGVDPQEVGHYRIRPPVKPVLLGDLVD